MRLPPRIRRQVPSDVQRRLLLLAEAMGDVADRLAIEQVREVMQAGHRPALAVTMLGRPAEADMSKSRAIGKLRDEWLRMVRDDPSLLADHQVEIAARVALLEAQGRPLRESEHG